MQVSRPEITALALGLVSAVLTAQSVTTSALIGTVKNASGSPLAGAQIRAISGQVVRTTTTDAEGSFRLSLLNPGSWRVTVSRRDFITQAHGIFLPVNQTATQDFKLAEQASATVEVLASSTLIDAASTSTGVTFSLERLEAVPRGREITELARLAPGVSDSGFSGIGGMELSFMGTSGAESSFGIDGLHTNDMRYGGRGVSLASEFVDQVDLQMGGLKPEHSALGGAFNVLTRSGGNAFAGSAWSTWTPGSLRPAPKRGLAAKEAQAPTHYDLGAWAGGALLKDKLFYSLGLNQDESRLAEGTNNGDSPIGGTRTSTTQVFAKLQYFPHPDHQFTLSHFETPGTRRQRSPGTHLEFADGFGTANTGATYSDSTSNLNLIYDGILSPALTCSIRVGASRITNDIDPESQDPRVDDRLFLKGPQTLDFSYSRGGYGPVENQTSRTRQASADLQWVLGSHVLKGGFSHMDAHYSVHTYATGGAYYTISLDDAGFPSLRERVVGNTSEVEAIYQAIYIQDAWEFLPGFQAFFGLRAEHQVQRSAQGNSFLDFGFRKHIQPRLGFTWDALGNGRSRLFASYAVYYEQIPQRMAMGDFSNLILEDYTYLTSVGADVFTYDPSAPNHYGTKADRNDPRVQKVDFAAYFRNPPRADGLKLPSRVEYQLGYEQNLGANLKAGLRFLYRKLENAMEDSAITDAAGNYLDPQGLSLIWNPHPGLVTWTAQDGTHVEAPSLFPEAKNLYRACVLSLEHQTSRSSLGVTYTWSHLEGNYEGLVSASNQQSEPNITQSWDFYTYVGYGDLPLDRRHQFKAYGSYRFEIGRDALTLGGSFLWQSGTPVSLFDDGSTTLGLPPGTDHSLDLGGYGSAVPAHFRLGQFGHTPGQARLDLGADYEVNLGRIKLIPSLQVFNVFNSRPATAVFQQATDAGGAPQPAGKWASPSAWQPGRTWRFGLRARF